jgi:hypothetical protein
MSDNAERENEIDEEMARADRANGENRPRPDAHERGGKADPEAPGAYVDEEDAASVPEPNEPA